MRPLGTAHNVTLKTQVPPPGKLHNNLAAYIAQQRRAPTTWPHTIKASFARSNLQHFQ